MNTTITFYPVDNGDCNLIEVKNGPKILWDCKFTKKAEDDEEIDYDVISELTDKKLTKKNGLPYVSAFILSHSDEDHCHGFEKKFYLGDPNKITQEDKDAKKILIGELWYSPRIILESKDDLSAEAAAFKKEAERRMKVYKDNKDESNKPGNRIRIIGWENAKDLSDYAERIIIPGTSISEIDGTTYSALSLFIHSPFKDEIEEDSSRNDTSIVIQFSFTYGEHNDRAKLLMTGDAEWPVWEHIIENNQDDDTLEWDIMEAPHHCSYTFFAANKEDDPKESSLAILEKKTANAFIVASSTFIPSDSTPPSEDAKKLYVEAVGKSSFLCTGGNKKGDNPAPIIFELDDDGFKLKDLNEEKEQVKNGQSAQPHVYG